MVSWQTLHLGAGDGSVEAVVADLYGDLAVGEVRPDERRLDLHVGLLPGVKGVPVRENRYGTAGQVRDTHTHNVYRLYITSHC